MTRMGLGLSFSRYEEVQSALERFCPFAELIK